MPAAIKAVIALLCLIVLAHIAVPVIMYASRGALNEEIRAIHPEFSAAQLEKSVSAAIAAAVVFHAVFLVLSLVFIVALQRRRRWVRRVITISSLLSVFFSIVSWKSSALFHALIIIVNLAHLAMIGLLWFSRESKLFFATTPS